jgi:predicted nucleic acid-binding protein
MIRVLYLDASALIKLVADDVDELPGRDAVRKYYWAHAAHVYSTSYSITEALSAFKLKYVRGRIGQFRRVTVDHRLRVLNCRRSSDHPEEAEKS